MDIKFSIPSVGNIEGVRSNYAKAHNVLLRFKKAMVNKAKANLRAAKKRDTGSLYRSIKGTVTSIQNRNARGQFTGGSTLPEIDFEMLEYGQFVDEGVKGTKENRAPLSPYRFSGKFKAVNVTSIEQWLARKGKPRKLAYIIAKRIYERGIKPTHFWRSPWAKLYPDYLKKYHKAVADDIALNIQNQIIKKLKTNGLPINKN